jgi:PTS system mannose-specific IIA component
VSKPSADVGVLVVTHGKLAEELVSAARVIVQGAPNLRALSIGWNDPVDLAREQVKKAIAEADRGRGVLVLTDMFGGTPTNLTLSFLARDRAEIITGVNLPMVVKTVNLAAELAEGMSLRDLAERVASRGRDSVIVASGMLEPESDDGR